MTTSWGRARAVAIVASALGVAAPVSASSGHVALVRQEGADPTITEAIHRIRGELVAEGFDVSEVDSPTESVSPAGNAAPETGTLATIDLSVDRETHIAELRVVDHITNKVVIRRTVVDESNAPHMAEVLAVRAVELLRASLLELLIDADRPAQAPSPRVEARDASHWAARALPLARESEWGVELGACVLADFGGVPPAVLGLARVRRTLVPSFGVRVTIAGLGTQPRVEAATGSANVAQDMGLLEVMATPWRDSVIRPFASLGAGALYSSVDGQTKPPYAGRQSAQWAAAIDGGIGAEARIGRRFGLSLEAHGLLAQPYPAVEFVGVDVARSGQPSIVGSLSVVGWL